MTYRYFFEVNSFDLMGNGQLVHQCQRKVITIAFSLQKVQPITKNRKRSMLKILNNDEHNII